MSTDVREITEQVKKESATLERVKLEIGRVIVGQDELVSRLLLALLCNNHVLIEGVPGLAKTLTVTSLAQCLQASFHRIQFTPDLLPADVVGTMIYNPKTGDFTTKKGPIFANIVLADEINRAPAKVQSALLEAMQERQVTVGDSTFKLDDPFMVLATQNPVEQEGTYALPEAQVDRFMFKLKVDYPTKSDELKILNNLVSGYFDFAEIQALRHKPMYMDDYVRQLDNILLANGEGLLTDGGSVSHEEAMEKALAEYRKFQVKTLSPVEQAYLDSIKGIEKKAKRRGKNNDDK